MAAPQKCAMQGQCGIGPNGKPLPCVSADVSGEPSSSFRQKLVDACGSAFASGPVCCDEKQVDTLATNFKTVDALVGSCPACRNNFHDFFCAFTCSPLQSSFVNVTSSKPYGDERQSVESVDFHVSKDFGEGFYSSCKSVQVGGANMYAMDLIGGGAQNYTSFFDFLGSVQPDGSPFQIDFPLSTPPGLSPLALAPRSCSDGDPQSQCLCIDCPVVCRPLPPVSAPDQGPTCQIGSITCLSFILIVAYGTAVLGFIVGYTVQRTLRKRRETYERVALSADTASPRSHARGLVGAGSLARYIDEDSLGSHSDTRHLGRGASLLDPIETVQPRNYPLNTWLRRAFYRLGLFAASAPWLTFALVFATIGLMNSGWRYFEVETDPVRLWVAPNSESKLQKEYFDEHFGPFYRTEQLFITALSDLDGKANETDAAATGIIVGQKPSVVSLESLKYWIAVEKEIRALVSPNGYTLDDVCFKPMGEGGGCVVQSVAAWFQEGLEEEKWSKDLLKCARSPVKCLPDFKQPLGPQFVLGGVPTEAGEKQYLKAEAFIATFVVSDSLDPAKQAIAMEWEQVLKDYLLDLSKRIGPEAGLQFAFSTGVSLEEEINKSTNMDVKIVVLSYLAMFLYVSLTLGGSPRGQKSSGPSFFKWLSNLPRAIGFRRSASTSLSDESQLLPAPSLLPPLPRNLLVGSKFTLGLFGIILVILSVSTSVGLFSFLGVKVTLIIAEVIPFLVLAVGVDNVFILVHELGRQNFLHGPNASGNDGTGSISAQRLFEPTQDDGLLAGGGGGGTVFSRDVDAASMPLYLAPEERVARTVAKMGPSILLSTITETTAFALGALVPMPAVRNFALYAAGSVLLNAVLQVTIFVSALTLDLRRYEANRVDCFPCVRLSNRIALTDGSGSPSGSGLGRIARIIRKYYAPFLLQPFVKGMVILVFLGGFVASIISIQHLELGLDQRLALPSESYLVPYFDHLDAYLDIGPPVYFVSADLDILNRPAQQKLCGRFTTCLETSLANRLEGERKRVESSFIAEPTASWVDDFLNWLNPANSDCCRVKKRNKAEFCSARMPQRACEPCLNGTIPPWDVSMNGFPTGDKFMYYLQRWQESPTTQECPLAGKATFGDALSFSEDRTSIQASHFRTFHKPLKSQKDFIDAFAAAHRIADEISADTGSKVFPYSLFYVFFDQYAHIVSITQEVLGLGLAAVLIVTALLLGSWRTGTIVTSVVALTVLTVMGVMAVWDISLNAISLVNLVISLGISVEFCAHVARAFMSAGTGLPVDHPSGQRERDERMFTALIDVGPSVLSGITFTKLIGMSVLALTRSRLLEIYYFRMWLTLIISGALHGLVLLPVVLSLAGGTGFPQQEADEEWMTNAIRADWEYAPFLADDDSIRSD